MGAAEDVPGEGVPDGPGDRDLLEALRSGDDEAYALLWRRHHPAALRAARQYDHSTEAEDIAAEAFARVLDAVRRGNGPRESFRAYLLRAVANVAQNAARTRRRTVVAADESVLDSPVVHDDPAIEALDQHYIAQAFERLTPPQKEVLWYVEVEQTPTKDAAAMMGLTANATSQMAGRARDALSREFLQMHIDDRPDDPQCTAALSRMGRYALGSLTRPQRKRVDTHVTGCVACADALAVVCDLRASMREILGPLVVGSTAMGYFGAAAGGKAVGAAAGAGAGASGGGATPRGPNTARNLAAAAVVAVMLAGAALAAVLIAGGGDPPKEEGTLVVNPPAGGGGEGGGGGGSGGGGGDEPPAQSKPEDPAPPAEPDPQPETSEPDPSTERPPPSPPEPEPEPGPEPPREPRPTPEPEPTREPEPTPGPSPSPGPEPTPSPEPTPTPEPTPSPTPPPSPEPTPPPEELQVGTRHLTGPQWQADPAKDYVVVEIGVPPTGAGDTQGSDVTNAGASDPTSHRVPDGHVVLRIGSPLTTEMGPVTGTLPPGPPLRPDGRWECTAYGLLGTHGYRCVGEPDTDGRITAAVEITQSVASLVSPPTYPPYYVYVRVDSAQSVQRDMILVQ